MGIKGDRLDMKQSQIGDTVIGIGEPKICVPIFETTEEKILETAEKLVKEPVDILEWRADRYGEVLDKEKIIYLLGKIKEIVKNKPLIFTFRTKYEGGEKEIDIEMYKQLNIEVAKRTNTDLIDIEFSLKGDQTEEIINKIHGYGKKVICSKHFFQGTPDKETIVSILSNMCESKSDIVKIAVMPEKKEDVITLMNATKEATFQGVNVPIVSMAMGDLGKPTRILGGLYGSTITFGAGENSSAPGQVGLDKLREALNIIY